MKSPSVSEKVKIEPATTPGRESGKTTCQNVLPPLAPRSPEASTSEWGMRSSAAWSRRLSDQLLARPNLLLILFLTPPLIWLGVVYLGSLFTLLLQSFFFIDEFSGSIVREFSFKTYGELLSGPANLDIILRTATMAFSVSLGTALIGYPIAYYMAFHATGRTKALLYLGIMMPLWSSYLVRVYAWKLILAKAGIVAWFFDALGLTWLLESLLAVPVLGGRAAGRINAGS